MNNEIMKIENKEIETPKEMFTVREAASLLGIPYKFLRRGILENRFPAVRVGIERPIFLVNLNQLRECLISEGEKNIK